MLTFELMREKRILIITPAEPLAKADFERLSETVDPFITEYGPLTGLMIVAQSFPGWQNFDHQRNIKRIAAVTDSNIASLLPRIAEHLIHPDVRQFAYDEKDRARAWLENGP
jgi:hypothetical protein